MKKLVAGCLLAAVLLAVLMSGAAYLVWDYVGPIVRTVTGVTTGVNELGGLGAIEQGLATTAPFAAPESGELTAAQVDGFLRVQRRVRLALGARIEAFGAKYRALSGPRPDGSPRVPTLPELLAGIGDLSTVYLDAWRAQVEAMNTEVFSRDEFAWVRARVYQAAGLDAVRYDARDLERVIEAMSRGARIEIPAITLPDAPARNRALVAPHLDEMKAWLAMAVFGL
ncbi:MAG TPA: hypothetical protein VMW48_19890 [Vicinamibacterales bacterium]|nr:hypothetical protein [Vicinamibacterales bacterium]